MFENSLLKDTCPEMKITNNYARKTVVKELKSPGVPRSVMKKINSHTSAQHLGDYNTGNK